MDDDDKPKARAGIDWSKLSVEPEEGYLLTQLDGATRIKDLALVTGFSPEKVRAIVERLGALNTLEPAAPRPAPPPPPALRRAQAPAPEDETEMTVETPPPSMDGAEPEPPADATEEAAATAEQESAEDKPESPESPEETRNYRQLYETQWRNVEADQRLSAAQSSEGSTLCALCFDPDPKVIGAIMENTHVGLEHARLIAAHHKNSRGLDLLARRAAFVGNRDVQRLLLANDQLPDSLFNRICMSKRLVEVHGVSMSRDVPEKTRVRARHALRSRWQAASGEERAELVWKTEGRALGLLVGMQMDSQAAHVLSQRQIVSAIMVQNLARFPGTLPPLLAHLMRQPIVKRSPQLRTMILQHPNATSEMKRKG